MQVSSGAFSYQEAIRFALRGLADTGAYITYPTGHHDRIDVAVRRCVLTGVGQTAAAVAKKQAEDSGCEYMELTAHSGARPEHAKWQGQLVIIKGKRTQKYIDGLKVFTLSEIGYGDGAGFKGWNCRHNWHPYYVGYSTPNYTQEELKKLGFSFEDSKSNFIFATHKSVPARKIFQALRERHIYVRYFEKPRIDNYLRITIGTREEMQMLFDFLKDYLTESSK